LIDVEEEQIFVAVEKGSLVMFVDEVVVVEDECVDGMLFVEDEKDEEEEDEMFVVQENDLVVHGLMFAVEIVVEDEFVDGDVDELDLYTIE
jgi:hypothetical protein